MSQQTPDYASMVTDLVKSMIANGAVKDPSTLPQLIEQIGDTLKRVQGTAAPSTPTAPATPAPQAPAAPQTAERAPAPAAPRAAEQAPAPAAPRAAKQAPAPAARAPLEKAPLEKAPAAAAGQADETPAEPVEASAEAPEAPTVAARPNRKRTRRTPAAMRSAAEAEPVPYQLRPVSETGQKPAVPIRESVQPDYIVCLEDGRQMKMLKRHLRNAYNMSPEQYKAKWGLPPNYPLVAPNYAKQKSKYARHVGLGTHRMRAETSARRGVETAETS